jgi:hypothetical protein
LGHLLSESPELGHRPRLAYPGAWGAQRPSSPFLGELRPASCRSSPSSIPTTTPPRRRTRRTSRLARGSSRR